jgi:hypothetical protein
VTDGKGSGAVRAAAGRTGHRAETTSGRVAWPTARQPPPHPPHPTRPRDSLAGGATPPRGPAQPGPDGGRSGARASRAPSGAISPARRAYAAAGSSAVAARRLALPIRRRGASPAQGPVGPAGHPPPAPSAPRQARARAHSGLPCRATAAPRGGLGETTRKRRAVSAPGAAGLEGGDGSCWAGRGGLSDVPPGAARKAATRAAAGGRGTSRRATGREGTLCAKP